MLLRTCYIVSRSLISENFFEIKISFATHKIITIFSCKFIWHQSSLHRKILYNFQIYTRGNTPKMDVNLQVDFLFKANYKE